MMEENSISNSQHVDESSFDYYVKMKNKLRNESENFDFIMSHMPPAHFENDAYIKNHIKNLTPSELHARAEGLIKAQNLTQNEYLLEHMTNKGNGNFNHFRSQWSDIIWQTHENTEVKKIKIGEKVINSCDLDFSIAQSIELQDANLDPATEYYDWVKIQTQFENDIYSNGTTFEEIENRNNFIEFMDIRESEIKRIALLYSGAALNPNSPMQALAQEKLKFTLFKLSELRRLRDRMKATKSTPDRPKEENYNDNSLGEKRLNNMFMPYSLNDHLVDNHLKTKPVTSTLDQAKQKIANLRMRSKDIYKRMLDIRGISPKEPSARQEITQHHIRGFSLAEYNLALKKLNDKHFISN